MKSSAFTIQMKPLQQGATCFSAFYKIKCGNSVDHFWDWRGENVVLKTCMSAILRFAFYLAVSDLGFPARGVMCPSQQFSEGHFIFGRSLYFSYSNVPGVIYVINKCYILWILVLALLLIFWNLNQNIVLRRFCTRRNYIFLFLFLLKHNMKCAKMTQIRYLQGTSLLKPTLLR